MGIPRFGELIRRRYPGCWFPEGKAQVFTNRPGRIDLSTDDFRKKREVDTLYVDGNGLLHPAMQFTFAYGSFEDQSRQIENMGKTEDQLIREGTEHFLNAIESLCLEFRPQRLVLAIDGSAPVAKMIQQRQRRFGAKMDVTGDPALVQAWESTLKRSVRNAIQEEGSFVSVTIEFDASRRDAGERLISTRLELLQPGTPQQQIYSSLIENLVRDRGQKDKVRWYNVLSPETPLGFRFEGRWWYSVAMAASALAWRDVWKQNTYVTLFGMEDEPEVGINQNNKYIYGTGKINTPDDSPVLRYVEEFRRFRVSNSDFFVKHAAKVAEYCEKIGDYLVGVSPLYREILLLTGVGTNLERLDGKRIEWLMNVRAKMIQKLEREVLQDAAASTLGNEVEYPEYENGFRGAEGILHVSKFDSNSLTPGTSVMNLIDQVIQRRLSNGTFNLSDGSTLEALYSSHKVPGEGEHKLENLIDRETRDMHGKISLVYGLDADLFMLSLVRDHPICLVRENNFKVEKFLGRIPAKQNPKHASCHVVDIQALRRSLQEEGSIHSLDFTLLCFLFGNDFLRNVPGLIFDTKLQVVFDNRQTRNDEETNPYLFDFLFDVYRRVKSRKNIKPDEPLFMSSVRDILKIRWNHFHEYLHELSRHEKQIFGGMIRRMQLEEEREKLMTERQSDYVPVALRYQLLKKSIKERQVIKGDVIDQKAVWIRGVDAFDMDQFKSLWVDHITANIPGYDSEGINPGLIKSKADVIEQVCHTYLEGMEWAMRYYTNKHSFEDRQGSRKSILNTKWFYPYFHAPMISQLRDHLWRSLCQDSRRMFSLTEDSPDNLHYQLSHLFSSLNDREVTTEVKNSYPKEERDILDLLPSGYLQDSQIPMTETLQAEIRRILSNIRLTQTHSQSFPRSPYQIYRTRKYNNENVFSSGWSSPRLLYGFDEDTLLVAPSSTNFRVQLLAVLPPQSVKYFPNGITPFDEHISWMYPKGIPVDFTFRDRVHAATLIIPPPNLPVLEKFMRFARVKDSMDRIRPGMFPRDLEQPKINPVALKKMSYYSSMNGALRDAIERDLPENPVCVDMFAGVGISTMFLSDFHGKVFAYEPHRESFADLRDNLRGSSAELINDVYRPREDQHNPDLVFLDIPHEGSVRHGRDVYVPHLELPVEEVIEQLIERVMSDESRGKLMIVVKMPRGGHLRRIVAPLRIGVRFVKDTGFDVPLTYTVISVSRPSHGREFRPQYDSPPGSPAYRMVDFQDGSRSPDYAEKPTYEYNALKFDYLKELAETEL